jgi:hypothetical protein
MFMYVVLAVAYYSRRNFLQDFGKLVIGVFGVCASVPLDLCLGSMVYLCCLVLQ